MVKKITILLVLLLLGKVGRLQSQNTATEPLWIDYMLEPNPNYYKVKTAFDDYWKDSIPKRGAGYKVFKRWEWRVKEYLDDKGNVVWPSGALEDLLASANASPKSGNTNRGASGSDGSDQSASACPANGRWTPVGPILHPWNQSGQPTGIGRIAGIAFDPKDSNTLFVCAPQGGVWKSKDNGTTWNQIFGTGPFVNTIGATSMVVSYNNSDTMYVGTGDRDASDAPGYGVIASWDGGKTWVSRNTGMGNLMVGRIVMDARNSKVLLASTNGGIYRSTDGGASWSQRISGGAWDVVFHPYNTNIAYASISGYFYKSTNNGLNWTQITSGLPASSYRGMIAITKADRGYVYFLTTAGTTFQGLYRSTDSATTFSVMSTTPNILGYYDGTSATSDLGNGQGWYDLDLTADPKNKNTIYSSGINIWKSTNGGANWTQTGHWFGGYGADDIHADQHFIEFNNSGYKIYGANDGGIYYSNTAGSRWVNISNGIQNSQIYRIAQAKSDPFLSATGYQDNGSAQSSRDQFYTYYGGDGMDCQVDPLDASYVYGAYVYGSIYRAVDKTNVTSIAANGTNGVTESGQWLTPFVLQEGTPKRMFIGYKNIWRSDDVKTTGTITWTKISNNLGASNSVNIGFLESSPAKNEILYVYRTDAKLFRTSNATAATPTWTDLSTNWPSGGRWLEAHPKDTNIVYVCAGANVYKSRNRGLTWTSITSGLSGVGNIQCIVLDTSGKNDAMYIGTERGVYFRDTIMSSWINYNTGFPIWADVTDIDIYYSPKGNGFSRLIASTYGRGVWRSNLYNDGTANPVSGFYAFDSVFTVGGEMKLYENVKNSATSFLWKISPYTYSYIENTDSTSANPKIKFNAVGYYSVQLTATNCQGSNAFAKNLWVKVFPNPLAPTCYNTTTFQTNNYGIGIMKFTLSDNSNETGGYFDDGQNLDFTTNKIFRLKPSTSYTATIKTGLYNNEYFRIYLDYDNNGKFENYKSEIVVNAATAFGSRTVSFTTPANLKSNIGLRMRIMSDFNAMDSTGCRNLNYGQGEEYTVVYDNPKPYFKVNKTAGCTFENLIFTDTSVGAIGLWEWDFGTGATPATAVGKGPHTVSYSTTGTKNVRLRINGLDSVRKNSYVTISTGPNPVVVAKTGAVSGCEGRSVTLAARSSNLVPFTVQWQKNGVNIAGKTDTLLVLNAIALADSGNYNAVLINGACQATSGVIKLTVFAKPVAAFTENANTQCLRLNKFAFTNTSTIALGSISTNLWRLGDGTTQSTPGASRIYATYGSYTVKLVLTSNKGCMDSTSRNMTVNPSATPKFTVNDSDQCLSGNSFVFSNTSSIPSGSLTYTWQFGDATSSTSTAPTKSFSSSGIFTVRLISNSNLSCKDSVTKPVRVYSKPAVLFGVNSASQCFKGNSFVFSNLSVNADGTMAYKWTFGNGANSTSSAPTYSYPAYGNYTTKLVATSAYGCQDSYSMATIVYPQASVKFKVNDSDQCLSGNSFVFTNSSSIPSGTISYTWLFGDATNSSSTSPSKSYTASGIYSAQLLTNSDKGCKDTLSKPIRVYSQPTVAFTKNSNAMCLKGNTFNFTNTTTNTDGSLSYAWNSGSGGKGTATNFTYIYSVAGTYSIKLIATTFYGCKDSTSQNIKVYPQATLTFSVNDTDQCVSGNNFVFTNTSSVAGGTLNYVWNFGDASTSTAASPSHYYLFYGTYKAQLRTTTNLGCRDTAIKNIRVYAQPNPVFSISKTPQCLKGNAFGLTNTSTVPEGSFSNFWKFGNGITSVQKNPSFSYSNAGNFDIKLICTTNFGCIDSITNTAVVYPKAKVTFSVNDSDQCISGNNFIFTNTSTITSGTINSYTWKFGDGATANTTSTSHSYSTPAIFTASLIAVSNGICLDTGSKALRIYATPIPKFTLAPGNAVCFKYNKITATSTATSTDGTVSAIWQNGDATFGSGNTNTHSYSSYGLYNIKQIVSSSFGCKDSLSKPITIYAQPSPNFTIDKPIHCENEIVSFTNTSTIAAGTNTYFWDFAQGKTDINTNPTTTYASFGNYTILLVATSNNNCKDSIYKTTKIASIPILKIISSPANGCANQTLFRFTDSTVNPDGTPLSHYWDMGDGKKDSGIVVSHTYKNAGNFKITLIAKSPYCESTGSKNQTIEPAVKATFNTYIINPETRRFFATDTSIKGYDYFWKFGDGNSGIGAIATHTFPDNSAYSVSLKVRSIYGCTDSTQIPILINSPNYKQQNNAFNFYLYPNPTNGSFTYKFVIKEKKTIQVKLYDIVGQSALYTKTWTDLEPGTYYETVNMKLLNVAPGTYPFVVISENVKVEEKIIYVGGQ